MPRERLEIDFNRRRHEHVKRVFRRIALEAGGDFDDVLSFANQALAQQKARRQFPVISRCAHGHSHASAAYADFQRLFPRDCVLASLECRTQRIMEDFGRLRTDARNLESFWTGVFL